MNRMNSSLHSLPSKRRNAPDSTSICLPFAAPLCPDPTCKNGQSHFGNSVWSVPCFLWSVGFSQHVWCLRYRAGCTDIPRIARTNGVFDIRADYQTLPSLSQSRSRATWTGAIFDSGRDCKRKLPRRGPRIRQAGTLPHYPGPLCVQRWLRSGIRVPRVRATSFSPTTRDRRCRRRRSGRVAVALAA
jgi:hypothetical protein